MKKFSLIIFTLLCAWSSFAQHGNLTDIRLINGDSVLSGTANGTIFYNRVSNKFRFRQNGSWISIGSGSGGLSTTLSPGHIYVGNVSSAATDVALSGDASLSSAGAITVTKINGTSLASLATGILKNTTGTGVPSIAVAADFPTLNQNTTGSSATLTTPRNINGVSFNGSADITITAEASGKYILDQTSSSVASGTITLDMNSQIQRMFIGSASFATAKTMALSNTTNALVFNFQFEITDLDAALTLPSTWLMADSNFDGDDWVPPAIGKYEMGGSYDGTNWKVKIVGPFL